MSVNPKSISCYEFNDMFWVPRQSQRFCARHDHWPYRTCHLRLNHPQAMTVAGTDPAQPQRWLIRVTDHLCLALLGILWSWLTMVRLASCGCSWPAAIVSLSFECCTVGHKAAITCTRLLMPCWKPCVAVAYTLDCIALHCIASYGLSLCYIRLAYTASCHSLHGPTALQTRDQTKVSFIEGM